MLWKPCGKVLWSWFKICATKFNFKYSAWNVKFESEICGTPFCMKILISDNFLKTFKNRQNFLPGDLERRSGFNNNHKLDSFWRMISARWNLRSAWLKASHLPSVLKPAIALMRFTAFLVSEINLLRQKASKIPKSWRGAMQKTLDTGTTTPRRPFAAEQQHESSQLRLIATSRINRTTQKVGRRRFMGAREWASVRASADANNALFIKRNI